MRREVKAVCSQDILFEVNTFGWLYEPRPKGGGKPRVLPWITYDFQEPALLRILDHIERGEDLWIIKSRDMGASWMACYAMDWMYRHKDNCKFLMISRNEAAVYKEGDSDSLFWKVRFIHKMLPSWMLPQETKVKLAFSNQDNGSTMTGQATTGSAGVGGRATAAFVDEFSRIEEGDAVLDGTADTTDCRIFNFTFFGTANAAYRQGSRKDVSKLILPWWEHPRKKRGLYKFNNETREREYLDPGFVYPKDYQFYDDGRLRSVEYDAEWRRRQDPRQMAQNWDMDAQGSSYQFFDKTFIEDLQRLFGRQPYLEGVLPHDPDTGTPYGFVSIPDAPIKLWLNLDAQGQPPRRKYVVGCDISGGTGQTNSCASAIDVETGEKVLEFATAHLRPDLFAMQVMAICLWLRDHASEGAMVIWEMQGPGAQFSRRLLEAGYRNIYYRSYADSVGGSFKKQATLPGWSPSPESKRVLMEEYKMALAAKQFVNRSVLALDECLSMIYLPTGTIEHSGTVGAADPTEARVNHGDRVVADALAWKLAKERGATRPQEQQEAKPGSVAWRHERYEQARREEELYA